ncbi:hypothetical protein [Thermodesulfatator indicus]
MLLFLVFLFFLGLVEPVFAVQVHGPPEGFYSHMLAHVIFVVAILFLLYFLRQNPEIKTLPWRYFRWSLFFFLLWNLDAMAAHFLKRELPEEAFYLPANPFEHVLLGPLSWKKWAFYIAHLDHLLCVPAMFFLMQSLRHFYYTKRNL